MVTGPALGATAATTATRLVQALNAARAAHGVAPLRSGAALTRAARSHSSDMLENQYFDHGDFAGRMTEFHVPGTRMGENLMWGSGQWARAAAVVRAWLGSPEHRANMLDPRFTHIGVGVVRGTFLGTANAMVVTADFSG